MQLYKPTITFLLDTRKAKADGRYPLKLTLYCKPDKKRYNTGIDLTEEEWKKVNSAKLKEERLREVKAKMQVLLTKAGAVLEKLSPFSFSSFEARFYTTAVSSADLSLEHWFNRYTAVLEQEGRVGTRSSYNTALNSLQAYKANLKLTDITKEFLNSYERYMYKKDKSSSTIGIYLRNLRAIINQAIKEKVLKREEYPFLEYRIPGSRNIKKALSDEQLQLLINYKPQSERHQKAFDFWIFSYLCNGMNITDVLHLKHTDVSTTFLSFNRQKSIRTKKKDLRPIKVPLHPRAKEIMMRWKSAAGENVYLFPVLEEGLSAKTVKNRIQRFIKWVNKAMSEIRDDLGFDHKLGTYVARHSFSTRLMRIGASTMLIKESLGHSSVVTTENYLGSFADSVKTEFANLLTDFK